MIIWLYKKTSPWQINYGWPYSSTSNLFTYSRLEWANLSGLLQLVSCRTPTKAWKLWGSPRGCPDSSERSILIVLLQKSFDSAKEESVHIHILIANTSYHNQYTYGISLDESIHSVFTYSIGFVYDLVECGNNDCNRANVTCVSPMETCAIDDEGCHYRCVESPMNCQVGLKMDEFGTCQGEHFFF